MRKQDRLTALIHSLTQGEKKYFSQRSRPAAGHKSYLKLYELLSGSTTYHPEQLAKQLGKSKAYIANEKKYLEKNLLSSLREYHEQHPQLSILNHIAESILLMEKNLPLQAAASAQRAIALSAANDNWPLAWQANSLMLTLCSHPFNLSPQLPGLSQHYLQQMHQIAERLKLITEFELLSEDIYAAYGKRSTDTTEAQRKESRTLLHHPLLQNDYHNFQLLSYKYSLQSLLYARMGNYTLNLSTNQQLLALYEKQPHIDKMGYWNVIANLTQSFILAGNYEDYNAWMKKLSSRYYKHLPVDSGYIDTMLLPLKNVFDSGAYFRFLNNNKVPVEAVKQFTNRILRNYTHEKKITMPFHFVSLVYKTAACCLLTNNIDDSVRLLQKLMNEAPEQINPMSAKNVRLLLIIIHAQLGNGVLLTSLVKSLLLFGKKSGTVSPAEAAFVKELLKLGGLSAKKERTQWFRKMKEKFSATTPNTDTQRMLESIPVMKWIEMNL